MHAQPCHECGKPGTIFDGDPIVWFCHGCYARALNGGNAPIPVDPEPTAPNAVPLTDYIEERAREVRDEYASGIRTRESANAIIGWLASHPESPKMLMTRYGIMMEESR